MNTEVGNLERQIHKLKLKQKNTAKDLAVVHKQSVNRAVVIKRLTKENEDLRYSLEAAKQRYRGDHFPKPTLMNLFLMSKM